MRECLYFPPEKEEMTVKSMSIKFCPGDFQADTVCTCEPEVEQGLDAIGRVHATKTPRLGV
jgi:hypothetical protein